jgi:hypothetical protein
MTKFTLPNGSGTKLVSNGMKTIMHNLGYTYVRDGCSDCEAHFIREVDEVMGEAYFLEVTALKTRYEFKLTAESRIQSLGTPSLDTRVEKKRLFTGIRQKRTIHARPNV